MATQAWQPGKLYPPGSLVVPRSASGRATYASLPPTNPGFEDGLIGWENDPAPFFEPVASEWEIETDPALVFEGDASLRWSGDSTDPLGSVGYLLFYKDQKINLPVSSSGVASLRVTIRIRIIQDGGPQGFTTAGVGLASYDASDVRLNEIRDTTLVLVGGQTDTEWKEFTVSFRGRPGAAYHRVFLHVQSREGRRVLFDALEWDALELVPEPAPPPGASLLENPDFEQGATGWTIENGFVITTDEGGGYTGQWKALARPEGFCRIRNNARIPVIPGTIISMQGYVATTRSDDGGQIIIQFFGSTGELVGPAIVGSRVRGTGGYRISRASGPVPALAATATMAVEIHKRTRSFAAFDTASVSYTPPSTPQLMYKAVQPSIGASATAEPTWPPVLGQTVVDNEVIWEAVSISRVVWEARPIMKSGESEPDWPTGPGAAVLDGTISWVALTRRVEDDNCPQTTVTAIVASKVFKADGDLVRFSATSNPLDWTTPQDAGYLPTGLQQSNANDMAVLNQYRGNLVAFNASSFQMWQVDPDPEAMALLDQMDGIGSSWQQATQAVSNDLFYLSQLGVRTVGIANAAENLSAGDVGSPVDELIRAEIAAGGRILSTYYPGAGQFWLAFSRESATSVHVYSMSRVGQAGAWSRYELPFSVEAFAQLGDSLYIRHGDSISVVSEAVTHDEVGGEPIQFPGVVWWPWLDFGSPGQTKMLEGFDYVGTGQGPSIRIGYDQRSLTAFTPGYQISSDTMPGGMIPIPVAAPTLSVRLSFAGGEQWNVQSVLLSVQPMRGDP